MKKPNSATLNTIFNSLIHLRRTNMLTKKYLLAASTIGLLIVAMHAIKTHAEVNSAALVGAPLGEFEAHPNQQELSLPGKSGNSGLAASAGRVEESRLRSYRRALDGLPT